jgi:hypothetical protein
MRARDTQAAAHAAQLRAYRLLGPSARVALAAQMSDDARSTTRSGIRARHPGYSPSEVEFALRRLLLGDDLFRAAWPDEPLLTP